MITYDEGDWHIVFVLVWRGSVLPKAAAFATLPVMLVVLLHFYSDVEGGEGDEDGDEPAELTKLWRAQHWAVLYLVMGALLSFRTRQALGRYWEATTLLHQMRGEWFDGMSNLMAFSRRAKKTQPEKVARFRHTLVRLASLLHAIALHEMREDGPVPELIDPGGLHLDILQYLDWCKENSFDRLEVLVHMMQVFMIQGLDDGVLKVAPPILSRVFQQLARGLVNLHNARKIADTKFPFPYAQIISLMLYVHALVTPVIMLAIVDKPWWAAIFTFMSVLGMFSVNMIASQLEMPFGDKINSLPMHSLQADFNLSLFMLMHRSADLLPHTSDKAERDWSCLDVDILAEAQDEADEQDKIRNAANGSRRTSRSSTQAIFD